ncbi:hypothetical protein B0H34DRAFT_547773 [Crassisporium funariophilum]|nr:hypothetical protein B0H34DRAFT_547773 [Crassisporium funariophilum]
MSNPVDDRRSSETHHEPRSPLTLETLPESPPLLNDRLSSGRRMRLWALVFPFSTSRQDEWADAHNFATDVEVFNRRLMTVREIIRRLPPACKIGLIPFEGERNITSTGVIVTTNATPEELKLAQNLDYIKTVQKILKTDQHPYWTRPCPS